MNSLPDRTIQVTNGTNGTNGTNSKTINTTSTPPKRSPATLAIHGDDHLNSVYDVAPPIHLSTTFRYDNDPTKLIPDRDLETEFSDRHVYSRHTAPTSTRLEAVLSTLLRAPALTYSSGLSALHAAYIHLRPRTVCIGGGYHGSHAVLQIHQKLTGLRILSLDCPAEELQQGDVVHLETPVNPSGEALSIRRYAQKAHARGAVLLVDATFGPPGLQEPFALGADIVMHSGTKYLGGHSDMLLGVLATRREEWVKGLMEERAVIGAVVGSLEGWLGLRSLRTLEVRVKRQSESAEKLVGWLSGILGEKESGEKGGLVGRVVERVQHASLQEGDMDWLRPQMFGGFGPVFAIWMRTEELARWLPSKLSLFAHATSLGGVESLIEWRAMSDKKIDGRVLRVSVGLESWEDLRDDLMQGFEALEKENIAR